MIQLFFDGACEPINPGGTASFGWLLKENKKTILSGYGVVGKGVGMTNNLAEYTGLIEGIKAYLSLKRKEKLLICGDSTLICNMLSKKWGWNKKKTRWNPHPHFPHLKKLLYEAFSLLTDIDYEVKWLPREQNQQADDLSKIQ